MRMLRFVLYTAIFMFSSISAQAIPVLSQNLIVTGPSKLALESALRVGQDGGNPVDVAVAYALTLSVTHPYFGSIGGGGFAMINMDGKPVALDFREEAPSATHPEYYLKTRTDKRASWTGGAAVGVPGIPHGLWSLHQKHGKLKWSKLFKEALKYSKHGFPVSSEWYSVTKRRQNKFWQEGKFHLIPNGKLPLPGDTLKQPGLYQALKKFKAQGPKGFYEGAVAQDIVDSVISSKGDMKMEDMKSYTSKWRAPITTEFEGKKVYLMPPPSSGGVVIKTALELVKKQKLKKYKLLSVDELHLLSEIMSASFRGRALLGDPDFHKNPVDFLTSEKYIKKLNSKISRWRVSKRKPLTEDKVYESDQTTHFVVMNKKGQAVSMTLTLNGNYGSGVISKKYGVALNNEMDDFTTNPGTPNAYGLTQGIGNKVEPKKRPLSSMSPSLVLNQKGETVLAVGAPGGPRIINGTFQTLYRSMISGLNMERAIFTPRLHHQFLPRITFYERERFSPYVLKALEKRGHKLKPIHGVAIAYGAKMNNEGLLEAAADFRGEGFSGGL